MIKTVKTIKYMPPYSKLVCKTETRCGSLLINFMLCSKCILYNIQLLLKNKSTIETVSFLFYM